VTRLLIVSTLMTLNDLEPRKLGVLGFFVIFGCEVHIEYCVEMARDRQGPPANWNC